LLCFNPCFGGFCSKTKVLKIFSIAYFPVSILVLVDFALKPKTGLLSFKIVTRFNPCFGGFCSKTLKWKSETSTEIVSILVLVDFALKPSPWSSYTSKTLLVSILVLVDFALKRCCFHRKPQICYVSILVLVDFALKRERQSRILTGSGSFNPCFGGFCSKTL